MANDDDVDFDALMRSDGVRRLGAPRERSTRPPAGRRSSSPERPVPPADASRGRRRPRVAADPAPADVPHALAARPDPDPARLRLDALRAELREAIAERERARVALAAARTERDHADAAREATRSQLDALRAELREAVTERERARERLGAVTRELRRHRAQPAASSLRAALARRGLTGDAEATDFLLDALGRCPAELLDGLVVGPRFAAALETRLALVCTGADCQPTEALTVVHVSPERCEVCGGSNTRAAFESLLRASRVAGITRLVVVGGSPPYHAQLRALSRGTDLKLDLVSGRSKPGRRRARNDVERVVIWGASILDHGTSAAYDHLGSRLIRVAHRGIATMLREVAEALRATHRPL